MDRLPAHHPVDPDLDLAEDAYPATATGSRALHLRPSSLLLVFAGGVLGTSARVGVGLAVPPSGDVPWATAGINVVGAFLLGLLIGRPSGGPDHGRRRALRLLLGTGFLGGFTTYSALATDGALLVGGGRPGAAVLYGLGTVVVGGCAAWAGIATSTPRGSGVS